MQCCPVGHYQNCTFAILTHHKVHFKVAKPLTFGHNFRSGHYRCAVWYNSTIIPAITSFTPSSAMSQILIQSGKWFVLCTITEFASPDTFINPFMTDSDIRMAATYKLRTPSLIHQRMLDGKLHLLIKNLVFRLFNMPFCGSALSIGSFILTGKTATCRRVSFQFTADS